MRPLWQGDAVSTHVPSPLLAELTRQLLDASAVLHALSDRLKRSGVGRRVDVAHVARAIEAAQVECLRAVDRATDAEALASLRLTAPAARRIKPSPRRRGFRRAKSSRQ